MFTTAFSTCSSSVRLPRVIGACALLVALCGCLSSEQQGLQRATPANTTVKFDFFHKPLPEIPLPNDIATRGDVSSATGLRVNASAIASTYFEVRVRELIDTLDGWGVMQPIAIPFTGPLSIESILAGHRDADYRTDNDVVYLINVDPDSPELGRVHFLDVGQGNYPTILKQTYGYGPNDPRGGSLSLLFEEADEDTNGNGTLDDGEDTDLDGVLDVPNYLPGHHPAADDMPGRADALMTFYERETNTLVVTPMTPLRERTTYAVVVTKRLLDADGDPVGSPFDWVHHLSQTEALRPLPAALEPLDLTLDDVAFAFTYTTQSIESDWTPVRDGLYGKGVQHAIGDQFPAAVTGLLPMRDFNHFPGAKAWLLPGEDWVKALERIEEQLDDDESISESAAGQALIQGQGYADYFVVGTFDSPQLFKRVDKDGAPLGYNDQSWPADLDRVPAVPRRERVVFSLAVPRKEVSARGDGRPAPVVIMNHGHTGTRFDAMQWSAYLCKYGFAVLEIEGPSHGVSLGDVQMEIIAGTLADLGVSSAVYSIFEGRAYDQNADGKPDSGADFWTAYMFHTRDMVRQYLLDDMQLVRVIRGFDGVRRWNLDTDEDGVRDFEGLAGDFDGDGNVDIGGDAPVVVTGGSLGGMMTMLMGALEPNIDAVIPIVGGGALSTIGVRSTNGGAKVGFMIRALTPAYAGTLQEDGSMLIASYQPDLIRETTQPIGSVNGVGPGDTLVVENLSNGVRGCGLVTADGLVRASVASDVDDAIRIVFYRGAGVIAGTECEVRAEAEELARLENYGVDFVFQGKTYTTGTPLRSLAEGFGFRRGSPDMRKMQGFAQLILDRGDPAVYAPHLLEEPLTYPGTGETTGTHALMMFTMGDTSVPNSSGMAVARAAGLLDFTHVDARYGVPPNQVLIDNFAAEGVNTVNRFIATDGRPVLKDLEQFSNGDDVWTEIALPRLDPPLRLHFDDTDALGGKSAIMFAMTNPEGQHGFPGPGAMIDDAREKCRTACVEVGDDPCGCSTAMTYDVGNFLVNMLGNYARSLGTEINLDQCQSRNDCSDLPELPPARVQAERP